ncbi:hypothetical protein JL720_8514 [Aureococcus anophagefferens]|nr:hypothetical protein JL720_8514 [Aureococcus anophagefferens]
MDSGVNDYSSDSDGRSCEPNHQNVEMKPIIEQKRQDPVIYEVREDSGQLAKVEVGKVLGERLTKSFKYGGFTRDFDGTIVGLWLNERLETMTSVIYDLEFREQLYLSQITRKPEPSSDSGPAADPMFPEMTKSFLSFMATMATNHEKVQRDTIIARKRHTYAIYKWEKEKVDLADPGHLTNFPIEKVLGKRLTKKFKVKGGTRDYDGTIVELWLDEELEKFVGVIYDDTMRDDLDISQITRKPAEQKDSDLGKIVRIWEMPSVAMFCGGAAVKLRPSCRELRDLNWGSVWKDLVTARFPFAETFLHADVETYLRADRAFPLLFYPSRADARSISHADLDDSPDSLVDNDAGTRWVQLDAFRLTLDHNLERTKTLARTIDQSIKKSIVKGTALYKVGKHAECCAAYKAAAKDALAKLPAGVDAAWVVAGDNLLARARSLLEIKIIEADEISHAIRQPVEEVAPELERFQLRERAGGRRQPSVDEIAG